MEIGTVYQQDIKMTVIILQVIPNNSLNWMKNNQLHRLDGPAIRYSSGVISYWIEGKHKESWFNNRKLGLNP